MASAVTIESQMPRRPRNSGSSSTASTWNTSVRKKAISADTRPSLSAVKKEQPKMAKPEN